MPKMIALKRVKYPHGPEGREYSPGDGFEALSDRDAKGLYISGKASYGEAANKTDIRKPFNANGDDSLGALRDEYRTVVGKNPFNGWDAETLRSKMTEHRNEYNNRMMSSGE